jgi:hypothetical protein
MPKNVWLYGTAVTFRSFSAAARKMYELMGRLKGEDSLSVHKAGHFRLIAGILISLAGHRLIKRDNRLETLTNKPGNLPCELR